MTCNRGMPLNMVRPLHLLLRTSYVCLCGLLLLALPFVLWVMDRWALDVALDAHLGWKTAFANALPVYLPLLLLAAMSGRVVFSTLIVLALSSGVYVASSIKLKVLEMPVLLQDIHFIANIDIASFKLFSAYLGEFSSLASSIAIMAAILLLALVFWWEGRKFTLPRMARLSALAMTLVGGVLIFYVAWPISSIYDQTLMRPKRTDETVAVFRGGLFSNLIYRHVDTSQMDLAVDAQAIANGLEMLAQASLWPPVSPRTTDVKPDIIVILSEAFMDPQVIAGFATLPDIIPNFRRIATPANSGYFNAPTYGGGTVRTEFEILTGMPMWAFPKVRYPYVELPIHGQLPGLASFLADYGYRRFAIHANTGRFWNRNAIYKAMGIADFKTEDDFVVNGVKDGLYYSDESMTDMLLEQLSLDAATPALAVVISMQAHGPWAKRAWGLREPATRHALQLPSMTSDEELRTYLYHLTMADRQLGRLVDALEQRGRPWRLLFFGDHLPGLYAWNELEFVDGQAPTRQKVPWLIAGGGDAITTRIQEGWQLPSALLENAGFALEHDFFGFSSALGKMQGGADAEYPERGMPEPLRDILTSAAHANLVGSWKDHVHD